MRLLLDTHIFLWAVAGSRLPKPATRRSSNFLSVPRMPPGLRNQGSTTTTRLVDDWLRLAAAIGYEPLV